MTFRQKQLALSAKKQKSYKELGGARNNKNNLFSQWHKTKTKNEKGEKIKYMKKILYK